MHQTNEADSDMLCQVCDDSALTRHFGAVCCNACAAFFRRTIAGNRSYVCLKNDDCSIRYDIPKRLCRSCRFRKCIKVGMRAEEVQSTQKPLKTQMTPFATVPLPFFQNVASFDIGKMNATKNPEIMPTFTSLVSWHADHMNNFAAYLNHFSLGGFLVDADCAENLLDIWAICQITRTTVLLGGHVREILCFDNGQLLEVNPDKFRQLFLLSKSTVQDEFTLNFWMKYADGILELSKLASCCGLNDVDWTMILHCSVLTAILSKSTSNPQISTRLAQLKIEMEIYYSQTKLASLGAFIEILLNLQVVAQNAMQALRLTGRKTFWEIVSGSRIAASSKTAAF